MLDILKIAICEDDKKEQQNLVSMLDASPFPHSCTLFQNAEELLEIYEPLKFDLLLMDIYMEEMTGVEAVTRIRETDHDVSVAFLTSSEDFALAGFRLSALNYLIKPYSQDEINTLLSRAITVKSQVPSLTVSHKGRPVNIRLSQIISLEIQNHKVLISLTKGNGISVYEKLSDLMMQLPEEHFFQCHKSYCVNLNQVQYIDKELSCFVMSDEKRVPIRRLKMAEAKQAFQTHLLKQTRREP